MGPGPLFEKRTQTFFDIFAEKRDQKCTGALRSAPGPDFPAKTSKNDDVIEDRSIPTEKSDDVIGDGASEALRAWVLATSTKKLADSCRFAACNVLRTPILEGFIFSSPITSSLFKGSHA